MQSAQVIFFRLTIAPDKPHREKCFPSISRPKVYKYSTTRETLNLLTTLHCNNLLNNYNYSPRCERVVFLYVCVYSRNELNGNTSLLTLLTLFINVKILIIY
jgi:hypothetical protein